MSHVGATNQEPHQHRLSSSHLILIYQGEARARRFIAHLPEGETLGGELGQDGAGSERQGLTRVSVMTGTP